MRRVPVLLALLLAMAACSNSQPPDEGDDGNGTPSTQISTTTTSSTTMVEPPADELILGMTVEELQASGYVVVAPGQSIRIGAAIALSGPFPDLGRGLQHAAELALADVEAAGGVLGFPVEMVVEDSGCTQAGGTAAGAAFVADTGVVAVSGATCAVATIAMTPALEEATIPFVSPSAVDVAVISESCTVCNRVVLSEAEQANADALFAYQELASRNVVVIDDGSDYGADLAGRFSERFTELGGTVAATDTIQVGESEFRPQLAALSGSSPDLIFFGGYADEAGLLVRQRGDVGLGDVVFLTGDGALTEQYLLVAGEAAEGSYVSIVSRGEPSAANAEFDARFEAEFGVTPDSLGPFHAESHDSILVIIDAIRRVAQVEQGHLLILRTDLTQAIRSTDGLSGLTGTITCAGDGECGTGGTQVFTVDGGEFTQVWGWTG